MDYFEQIKHAKAYMYQFHKNDTTGHDVAHVERVLHLARYIAFDMCYIMTSGIIFMKLIHISFSMFDLFKIIHLNELLKIINLK